jgi:WD40 repeat protein
MMILRRHYGKLAATLLLAMALYGVWWALPVLPRPVLHPETCDGRLLSERLAAEERAGCHSVFYHASLRFSPDGQSLLTSNADEFGVGWRRCVQVWHTGSGKQQTKLVYTDESAARKFDFPEFQFSPDSRYLALGYHQDGEQTIDVLDLITGRKRTFPALRFGFSTNGKQVAIVDHTADGSRQRVRIRDNATGEVIVNVAQSTRPLDENTVDFWNLAFLGDGRTLVFSTYKPTRLGMRRYRPNALKSTIAIVLWDIPTQRARQIIYGAQDYASSPDGKLLAVPRMRQPGRKDIELWQVASGRFLGDLQDMGINGAPENPPKFSPDGTALTAASTNWAGGQGPIPLQQIATWDVRTRQPIALRTLDAVAPDGKKFDAYHDWNGTFLPRRVFAWYHGYHNTGVVDVLSGKMCIRLPDTDRELNQTHSSHTLSPDSNLFAYWEGIDQKPSPLLELLSKFVPGMNAPEVVRTSSIHCWDLTTGREFPPFPGGRDVFAFSADSRMLAAYCADGTIKLWDIPPRKPLGWFLGLAGLLLLLTLGGFWWQARRRKRQAALATEAIPCGT